MTESKTFAREYLREASEIINKLDVESIESAALLLARTRDAGGRLFILGVGGSAANASHAVNDFRKVAGIEAYAPTDNVAELTARTNDDGWMHSFDDWLRCSHISSDDVVLVLSVGGGTHRASQNILLALQYAFNEGAEIVGIVGPNGGQAAEFADG